jgi:hypothetical protein
MRTLRRIAGAVAALGAVAGLSVAGAGSAQAAWCATEGMVYFTFDGNMALTTESDDPNRPIPSFALGATSQFTFGGNGITPGQYPFLTVYFEDGTYAGNVTGPRTGGNCVANERTYNWDNGKFPLIRPYIVKGNYYGGNSGATITDDRLVRVVPR